MKNFADRLIDEILERKSYLCVGLDPQLRYFPPHILKWAYSQYGPGLLSTAEAIIAFNMAIINATAEFALCFKPQMAFYEKYGSEGVRAFEVTADYIKSLGMIVIEDAKREDGGDTSEAYADGHLGNIEIIGEDGERMKTTSSLNVDAITITPWIDEPNFTPFVQIAIDKGKGMFVVTKTSFKPASRLQEMTTRNGTKAWVELARVVKEIGQTCIGENGYSSIGVVMGATYPDEAALMRQIIPGAFKLVPGYGAGQKGKADDAIVSVNDDGFGAIINNSRGTNYAWHPNFKSEFSCDSRYFANAAARASQHGRDELNAAVLRKIGRLPWQ